MTHLDQRKTCYSRKLWQMWSTHQRGFPAKLNRNYATRKSWSSTVTMPFESGNLYLRAWRSHVEHDTSPACALELS